MTNMAMYRFMKRRLNFLGLVIIATVFWIFYLIISAPATSESTFHNGALPHDQGKVIVKESVTRKVIVPPPLQPQDPLSSEKKEEKQIQPPRDSDVVGPIVDIPEKQVIPRPPPELDKTNLEQVKPFGDNNEAPGVSIDKSGSHKDADRGSEKAKETNGGHGIPKTGDLDVKKTEELNTTLKVSSKNVNDTGKASNATNNSPVLQKVENKVIQLGESFKNKTLEKLADLGVIKKQEYIKLIYTPVKWNLNLSIEDIGNIMKDTQYFQVKQNVTEMEYHPLMSPNSTQKLNVTEVKYGLGYCDCKDLECMCCVRIYNKWMRLNSTACSLITFSSKLQELRFIYTIDKVPVFDRQIAAEFPPKICMESSSKAAGICTLFSNVTAKVNIESDIHKIHLSGCMEFDLTLYNRTVSSFPVGCFEIPGLQSDDKEKSQAQNLGNFMP